MTKDEIIAWVKQRVDLFTIRHGTYPTYMVVNEKLFDMLGKRSHWMDTKVQCGVPGDRGYEMELWLGGTVSIEALGHIPVHA